MPGALETCISEVVAVVRGVSGIQNVPLNPPSVMSYSTFGLVYPSSGTFGIGPIGTRRGLHSVAIDILTKDVDIARSMATLKPMVDSLANALIAEVSIGGDQFNNSIETFGSLTYNWIPLTDYGGVPVVGWHFLMNDVKILVNL
jgi:hypothetical protein